MATDLQPQVREVSNAIEAKKALAAEAFTVLDGLRKSAVSEKVDFTTNVDAFEKLDAAGKAFDSIKDDISALEGRRNRLMELTGEKAVDLFERGGDKLVGRTFGETFVKSDAYQEAKARAGMGEQVAIGQTSAVKMIDRLEMKTVLTSAGTQSPVPDRQSFIVAMPLAPLSILDVIAIENTDSDVVEWLEETTYTNAAAGTAEGTAALESALAFTKRSANVHEIPHFIPVTRRSLTDQAYVQGWVDRRLVDGVKRRLNDQILSGGGTGEDFTGIYGWSGVGMVDRSVLAVTMLDSIHSALTTIRVNALDYGEPDFVGINPADYETIRLTKAAVTGTYLYGDPVSSGPKTIWGLPAIVSAAFTSGTPLVGIGKDAMLFIKEGVSVSMSDSHSDYFTKRQIALLATMRAAFGVLQPKSFCFSQA